MVERIDHFAKMRSEQEPLGEPPPEAPAFSMEQLEWLQKQYPVEEAYIAYSQDGLVEACVRNALLAGNQHVIKHIRTLVRGS